MNTDDHAPLDMSQLALRIDYFLRLAIDRHRRDHQGRYPRWIELHPRLEPALRNALGADYRYMMDPSTGELKLYGMVPLRYTPDATTPRMMNCRHAIESL